MVEKGVPVNSHLANSLQVEKKIVLAEPSLQYFHLLLTYRKIEKIPT
jgi:hypothetical protein